MSRNGHGNGQEIDLRKHADREMVNRAIRRRWPISEELKSLLIERAKEALENGDLSVRELGAIGRIIMGGEDQNQEDENKGKADVEVQITITRETLDTVR